MAVDIFNLNGIVAYRFNLGATGVFDDNIIDVLNFNRIVVFAGFTAGDRAVCATVADVDAPS